MYYPLAQNYVEYQRQKWRVADEITKDDYGLSGDDDEEINPNISKADIDAAAAHVNIVPLTIDPDASLAEAAKQLRKDADVIRSGWPPGEQCFTAAGLQDLYQPLAAMVSKVARMGEVLASSGIRRIVGDRYLDAKRRLSQDAFGKFGFGGMGPMLVNIQKECKERDCTMEEVGVCIDPEQKYGDLSDRIHFVLLSVARTLETYDFLDDARPWFTKNRVADWIFESLYKVGSVVYAIWEKTKELMGIPGAVAQTFRDLQNAAGRAMDVANTVMWVTVAGGCAYLAWKFGLFDKLLKPKPAR